MKTLALILVAAATLGSRILFAQGCLPEGITFENQEQIDNFQANYPGCTEIEGDVMIFGSNITNIDGLNILTSIGGNLTITENVTLINLTGLENLNTVGGGFYIDFNNSLTDLAGLENLTSINGTLFIGYNATLTSLTGLDNLDYIHTDLYIVSNDSLTSLFGLANLSSIGEDIFIYSNESLTNIQGLNALMSIKGDLSIIFNSALINLDGLENLNHIEDDLWLEWNSALTSVTSLTNLTFLGGSLGIVHNNSLTSLIGLDNLQSNSLDTLSICFNSSLTECSAQSVCNYLASQSVIIYLGYNAPGCNSPEEVILACQTAIDENKTDELAIFPNPATSSITLTTPQGEPALEAVIYNYLGQKVVFTKPVNNTVDVSGLKAGMYLIEISTKDRKERTKFVKNGIQ